MGKKFWRFGQVTLFMLLIRSALTMCKLPRILTWLSVPKIPHTQDFDWIQDVNYYSFLIFRKFPANPRGNCLPRSLVLYWFGRKCGFPVRFHCGVRWLDTALDGHAWLTLHGEPFLEPRNLEEEGYHETYAYPDIPRTEHQEGITAQSAAPFAEASLAVRSGSPVGATLTKSQGPPLT